jgi:hypothetical protein
VEIDAFLCDHAEAAEGKLFVNGAAINLYWAQPQPPHLVTVYVAAVVQVPYTATNQPHTVTVRLMDPDENAVRPWAPEGVMDDPGPIEVSTSFNVGRPPTLPIGDSQVFPLAFGFQFALNSLGLYHFAVEIDGTVMRNLPIRVAAMPQQQQFGPASIPGMS